MNTMDDYFVAKGEPCKCQLLAESDIGAVEVCFECGMVRLSVQALSLRMEPEAFQALALMVGEAHIRLRRLAENTALTESVAAGQATTKPH